METNYYNAGVYTYEELQKAIKAEREKCALICLEFATNFTENTIEHNIAIKILEAIRARGE